MKLMICVPCLDMMHTSFVTSLLAMERVGKTQYAFEVQSLVYESRHRLLYQAINAGADRILWLDSDMVFEPDLAKRLSEDMDMGKDFVTAIYYKRRLPTEPLIVKSLDWYHHETLGNMSSAEPFTDWPKDRLFRIAGCGMGACMMSVDVLKDAITHYKCGPFEPVGGLSEDFSLCWRIAKMGVAMWADPRIPVGHAGLWIYGEKDWNGNGGIRNEHDKAD